MFLLTLGLLLPGVEPFRRRVDEIDSFNVRCFMIPCREALLEDKEVLLVSRMVDLVFKTCVFLFCEQDLNFFFVRSSCDVESAKYGLCTVLGFSRLTTFFWSFPSKIEMSL